MNSGHLKIQHLKIGNLKNQLESSKLETWKIKKTNWKVREPPAPLNIPTQTPAPDHLLGGHNELGGTIVE